MNVRRVRRFIANHLVSAGGLPSGLHIVAELTGVPTLRELLIKS